MRRPTARRAAARARASRAAVAVSLLLTMTASTAARAESTPDDDGRPARDWSITFTPYAWVPVISGKIVVDEATLPIEASVADLLQASDRAGVFLGALELRYKRVAAFADGTYLKLGFDTRLLPVTSLELKTDVEFVFIDFGLMYRLLSGAPRTVQPWTIDVLAGGRYSSQAYEISVSSLPGTTEVDKAWWDPIIGGRAILDMTARWRVQLYVDVGGFGAGSDLTTQGKATLGYRFFPGPFELQLALGYRALYQDISDRGGNADLDYDATVHGPLLRFDIGY